MRITRLRGDRTSPTKNTCPALWMTDEASPALELETGPTFIVQGKRVTDAVALSALDMPDDETAVEVPMDLLLAIAAEDLIRHDDHR